MKITCTKEEYTALLRKCFHTETFDAYRGCLLEGLYDGGCSGLEKAADINIVSLGIEGENNG